MSETPRLGLPEIAEAQASKYVTHNEALRRLDAAVNLTVQDRDLTSPPGSPSEGDAYIVADSATGDWSGEDGNIAVYVNTAWAFIDPGEGWRCWVTDEHVDLVRRNGAWVALSRGETVQALGSVSGAVEVDLRLGTYITCTLTGDTTFSFTGVPIDGIAQGWSMEITESAGSPGATITWPGGMEGSPETSPTQGGTDLYVFAGVGSARIIGARAVEGL